MALLDSEFLKENGYAVFHYEPMGNGKEGVRPVDIDEIPPYEDGWISVENELPEVDGVYLVGFVGFLNGEPFSYNGKAFIGLSEFDTETQSWDLRSIERGSILKGTIRIVAWRDITLYEVDE